MDYHGIKRSKKKKMAPSRNKLQGSRQFISKALHFFHDPKFVHSTADVSASIKESLLRHSSPLFNQYTGVAVVLPLAERNNSPSLLRLNCPWSNPGSQTPMRISKGHNEEMLILLSAYQRYIRVVWALSKYNNCIPNTSLQNKSKRLQELQITGSTHLSAVVIS